MTFREGRDLANLCPTEILALRRLLRCGFARIREYSYGETHQAHCVST
jgi:hypothetical protein